MQNRIWLETVQIALNLPAWMPMPTLTGKTRLGNPDACGCFPRQDHHQSDKPKRPAS